MPLGMATETPETETPISLPRTRAPRGGGSIERYKGGYRVSWWGKRELPNGKKKRVRLHTEGPFDSRDQALAARDEVNGKASQLAEGTVASWAETHWLPLRLKAAAPSAATADRWRLVRLADWYDKTPITQVTADHVCEWIEHLATLETQHGGRYARTTLHGALCNLRRFFAWMATRQARELGSAMGRANPCAGLSVAKIFADNPMQAPPHRPTERYELLDPSVVENIIAHPAIPADARAFFLTVAFSGIRPGHLLQVRWSDLNLQTGVVAVRSNRKAGANHGTMYMTTVLVPGLRALQAWHRERQPASPQDLIFGAVARAGVPAYREGLPRDTKYRYQWQERWSHEVGAPGVLFYSLKHTCASMLVLGHPLWCPDGQGWTRDEIQPQLGHRTPHMADRYVRTLGKVGLKAAERVRQAHAPKLVSVK